MNFQSPWVLLLLSVLPLVAYAGLRRKRTAAVKFSSLAKIKAAPPSWRVRLRPVPVAARLLCMALVIVALARPRKGTVLSEVSTEGVAIEMVVDRSGSMGTEMDYYGQQLTRLDAVKQVFAAFIQGDRKDLAGRDTDLIGLVTFARYADTTCPLVLSHSVLLEFLRQTYVVPERSAENATAIGDALALAAARLKKAEEEIARRRADLGLTDSNTPGFKIKSKVILLLTDGQNNAGDCEPLAAADLAAQWGIKVYTVGIGSSQTFRVMQTLVGPMRVPVQNELDEALLNAIAEKTGGFYGRADDADALYKIVEKINQLEKTSVKSQVIRYAECFAPWTWPALALLVLELVCTCTVFRKIP